MKKIISALLMLSMLITGITITPNTTKNVQAATTIKANKWYTGMTDGDNAKVYTYKMQGSGYFYYQIMVNDDDGSSCIYTSMIKNYKSYEHYSTAWNAAWGYNGEFRSGIYSFKAGDKVNIKVEDEHSRDTTRFKIKVTFVKVKNFEKENNNSKSKANKLKKGVTHTGIAMKSDVDWFVFKAPKTKKYKIKGVNVNGSSWVYSEKVEVYKGKKRVNYVSLRGTEGWYNIYSGKLKKGQKIYLKLHDEDGGGMYKIKVK